MSDDGSNEQNTDGGALRKQLESTIETNKQLTTELATYKAKDVISTGGYTLVKPEDLVNVPLDKMADKAAEIQQDLQSRIEAAGGSVGNGNAQSDGNDGQEQSGGMPDEQADQFRRVRSVSGGPGQATSRVDYDSLTPQQKMELAFSEKSPKR